MAEIIKKYKKENIDMAWITADGVTARLVEYSKNDTDSIILAKEDSLKNKKDLLNKLKQQLEELNIKHGITNK